MYKLLRYMFNIYTNSEEMLGCILGPQCSDSASAHIEMNWINFVQESDEMKPRKYVIMTDLTRLP